MNCTQQIQRQSTSSAEMEIEIPLLGFQPTVCPKKRRFFLLAVAKARKRARKRRRVAEAGTFRVTDQKDFSASCVEEGPKNLPSGSRTLKRHQLIKSSVRAANVKGTQNHHEVRNIQIKVDNTSRNDATVASAEAGTSCVTDQKDSSASRVEEGPTNLSSCCRRRRQSNKNSSRIQ